MKEIINKGQEDFPEPEILDKALNSRDDLINILKVLMMLIMIITMITVGTIVYKYAGVVKANPCKLCVDSGYFCSPNGILNVDIDEFKWAFSK